MWSSYYLSTIMAFGAGADSDARLNALRFEHEHSRRSGCSAAVIIHSSGVDRRLSRVVDSRNRDEQDKVCVFFFLSREREREGREKQ